MLIPFEVEFSINEIKNKLLDIPREKLLLLIMELDEEMQDWNFTLALYEHFTNLKKQFEEMHKKDI